MTIPKKILEAYKKADLIYSKEDIEQALDNLAHALNKEL